MNYNVVVVDDDEIVLFLHSKIIQAVGLHESPKTFNSALKALEFFKSVPDDTPILLFLDINMPVMDGWGLLDIIHQEDFDKKIEVVMVTSSVDQGDKDKAESYSKIIEFVEKPFSRTNMETLKLRLL
ncbi:response regulator [Flavobacterium degerlachei]|jgi:CheY-like chemotaxis protein|uniref:Response regulator receiver domain-containing protein n=1 Tax=Flavobacterium degerlachei TaxID=229203 RepID=A0A1H2QJJ0_9FLAO|nr:response regulator [Flavobacterium degerlachei]SDW06579.1 Response regulator receiver domain-containing protein [Flavobacterium degerlachei]